VDEASNKAAVRPAVLAEAAEIMEVPVVTEVPVVAVGHLEGDEAVGHRPRAGVAFPEVGRVKEAEVEAIMDHPEADAVEHAVEVEEGSRLEQQLKFTGILYSTLAPFVHNRAR
jgi:hypothetical protein